jgi:hypothetical protein
MRLLRGASIADFDRMAALRSYREFWPYYVRAHSRLSTQRAHMAATLTAIGWSIAVLWQGEFLLVLLAPVLAYAIAIPSHFIFQGNKPTVIGHPLWSAVADVHMCALLLAGRMGKEVARASVPRDLDALDGDRIGDGARLPNAS